MTCTICFFVGTSAGFVLGIVVAAIHSERRFGDRRKEKRL
jgi:hypothetical protein